MSKRIKGITIEIDGETKGLDKALGGVNKQSSKLQKELRDVEKLLKFNPGNTELLAQKQKLLGDQVNTTRDKLNQLKSAQDSVNQAFQNGDISEEQYRAFQREIAETESKLKHFESQLEQSQTKLEKFGDGFRKAGESVKAAGEKVTSAGKTMTKNVSAPIMAAGVAVSKFAVDQEKSFAKVSTLLTGSSGDYEKYKKDIRRASSDMGVAFDEYSESVYGSISAGVEQGEAIKFTGEMVKLAKGGFTDTATAVDVVTTSLNAYGMETSEATRVADMLITTQNLGKTTVDELASSLGSVIPSATAQNVSIEQLNAGYATLTKNGIGTSEAGTKLKAMFDELGKSGSKTDKIIRDKMGKSFSELQEEGVNVQEVLNVLKDEADQSGLKLGDLFSSSEAAGAALTISGAGAEDFRSSLAAMNDAAGATETAFQKMNNTTGQKMQEALIKMQNAAAQMGDILLPIIARIAEFIARLVDKFSTLSPAMQKNIVIIAGIAAAIGPLLIVIGTMLSAIGNIMIVVGRVLPYLGKLRTAFTVIRTVMLALTGPIGIAIAIITALGIAIYKNWDDIKAKTMQVWNAIPGFLSSIWSGIKTTIQNVWNGISTYFTTLWAKIKTEFTTSLIAIRTTVTTVFNAVKSIITTVWNGIKTYFTTVLNIYKTLFTTAFNAIRSSISSILNAIGNVIKNLWNGYLSYIRTVLNGIKSVVTTVWNGIRSVISTVLNGIRSVVTSVWNAIRSSISSVLNGIRSNVTSIWNSIRSAISSVLNGIRSTVVSIWNSIRSSITSVVNGIRSTVTSVFNSIRSAVGVSLNGAKSVGLNAFNALRNGISGVVNGIQSTVTSVFSSLQSALTNPIQAAKNTIIGIINTIKSAFANMRITIPKPKLPRISVSTSRKSIGGIDIPIPSFNVDWFKKGGVFGSASVIGVGEEPGVSEAVIPLKSSVLSQIGKGIAETMGGTGGSQQVFNIYSDKANPIKIARTQRQEQRRLAREWGG